MKKSIPEDAARGHVLLGLEVGKVEAGCEDEDVGHHDEALQERHRHLDRHPLRRLEHVKLVLQNQGGNMPTCDLTNGYDTHVWRCCRCEEWEESAAGDDEVVRQLRDEVHRVHHEHRVLRGVDKVQHGLGRVRAPYLRWINRD